MSNIDDFYISKYGEPSRQARFTVNNITIYIYKWTALQTNEGVAIYATSGAREIHGDKYHSCEFFLGITPEVDSVAESLAEVAVCGTGKGDVPNSGDSITLAYPLWEGTSFKSYIFSNGDEILPPQEDEGKQINFIQLVPIFESELNYKKIHGEESLWELFEKNMIPYWSSTRKQHSDFTPI